MLQYLLPLLYALFIWWFSTGLILYLDSLSGRTFRWSMAGATVFLLLSLVGLVVSGGGETVADAYLAFTCGVVAWGWLEMSYFMGFVTGPRKEPCPPGCTGWQRFILVIHTSLYHELAILLIAAVVITVTWGEPNQVGTWTFMVLWWMRLSAQLNVFLGVPNLNEAWLPEHIQFLTSYVTKKPMNLLFPVSVTVSTVVAVLLVQMALAAGAGTLNATGLILLAALLSLGILEHWFLVLPLPDEALWSWAIPSRGTPVRDKTPFAQESEFSSGKKLFLGSLKSILANKQQMLVLATASAPLVLSELPLLAKSTALLPVSVTEKSEASLIDM